MSSPTPSGRLSVRELCILAFFAALMFSVKTVLASIPNVNLNALLIILVTVCFGWRALYTVGVYILLEGLIFDLVVFVSLHLAVAGRAGHALSQKRVSTYVGCPCGDIWASLRAADVHRVLCNHGRLAQLCRHVDRRNPLRSHSRCFQFSYGFDPVQTALKDYGSLCPGDVIQSRETHKSGGASSG